MRNKLILICVLIGIFTTQCDAQKNKTNKNLRQMKLEYADGNGNYYKITNDSIHYKPITKAMSSSGMYDGGEPAAKKIKPSDFEKIYMEFEAIFKNTEIQIKYRIKTSGMLTINTSNPSKKTCIIKSSNEQEDLEKLLKSLLE